MQARRFSEQDVAQVRDRADLVQLVEDHGVRLRRTGSSWKGLCPFHDEKTPSFSVRPDVGAYHCFGCGESGDAIEFAMATMQLPFPDAVRHLASLSGITLAEHVDPAVQERDQHERAARGALEVAAELFQQQLLAPDADHARTELTTRRLGKDDATRFGCGYAPRGSALVDALHSAGVSVESALAAGLLGRDGERVYPFFTDRLMFPITDRRGRLSGFGGRQLRPDQKQKYLNSPEGLLFRKRELLYGLSHARTAIGKAGRVLVVEGYTDVMACHAAGVGEAVATCGTAFGEHHLKHLTQGTAPGTRIVFCFDGDAAGVKAAHRAFDLARGVANRLYVAQLPDSLDPCDVFKQHGDRELADATSRETPMTRWLLEKIAEDAEPTPEGRSRALAQMGDLIGRLTDPVLRDGYTDLVHNRWGGPRSQQRSSMLSADPCQEPTGWELLQRRVCRRLLSSPCEVWPSLANTQAPALSDPAARAVMAAARAVADGGLDPLAVSVRSWAGAVMAAARENDAAGAAAVVFGTHDDEQTPTDDLMETYWDHGEQQSRQEQVDHLVTQMAAATTDEESERLWAQYDQLMGHCGDRPGAGARQAQHATT